MMLLLHNDREELVDVSFRFLSWLAKNLPEIKDRLSSDIGDDFGSYVRKYPSSFWGDVGNIEYEDLIKKSARNESILDKVAWYSANTKPEINGEILVGFVEGHMFKRPDSPLAKELGEMIGRDLSGLS